MIPAARQSAVVRKIQDLIPLPNLGGAASNFLANGSQRLDKNHFDTKVNWNRNTSHTVWGKYSIVNANVSCAPAFGQRVQNPSHFGVGIELEVRVEQVGSQRRVT